VIWRALLLLPALLVDSLITILGWFIVPILAALKLYDYRHSTKYDDGRVVLSWTPRWAFPWGNEEDGIDGLPMVNWTLMDRQSWWDQKTQRWSEWRTIVVWAAFRNGASNLRFTKWWGLVIDPRKVKVHFHQIRFPFERVLEHWFVSQGWRSNYMAEYRGWRFWIGWAIKPYDADNNVFVSRLPQTDTRHPGVGFKLQLKRVK